MSATALSQKVDVLIKAGIRGKAIAERAKCDSSTISRIRSGFISDPNYSIGSTIDQMYSEYLEAQASAA